LETYYSAQGYPEPLRRIRYYDAERDKLLVFLTDDFSLPATTIAALYKSRWRIELFFIQFEKTPLIESLSCESYKYHKPICPNQLVLFE
jgi:IS4 transposase